jgi:hypothetical protein
MVVAVESPGSAPGRPSRRAAATSWLRSTFPWREVLLPFAVSRVLVIALAAWGASPNLWRPTFGSLVSWDGSWYRQIALDGYGPPPPDILPGAAQPQTRWPFFPLLPGLGRAVSELGIPMSLAFVLVSHAAFLLALAGMWRLLRPYIGDRASRWAIWACCLFPFTVVFSMAYPSSLFLAGTVWSFVYARERRDVLAGLWAIVPAMARPNGFIAVAALTLSVVLADGIRRGWRRAVVVAGPAAAGVLAWCALCWRWTGDPLVFFSTKDGWDELTIVEALDTLPNGARPHLVCLVVGLVVIAVGGRKLPAAWLVFAGLYLAPAMVLGVIGTGRYVNELFPVAAAGGVVLARLPRVAAFGALAVSIVGMVIYAWMLPRQYLP